MLGEFWICQVVKINGERGWSPRGYMLESKYDELTVEFRLGEEMTEDLGGQGGCVRDSGKVVGPKDRRSWQVRGLLLEPGSQWQ